MNDIEKEKKILQGKRLTEFRNFLGKTQVDFANDVKLDRAYLAQIETGAKGISRNVQMNVTICYNNLNLDWLMNGEGFMIKEESSFSHKEKLTNVKLYNIEALAGSVEPNDQIEVVVAEFYIPDLIGSHSAVTVKGNSMESTILDGDLVVLKKIDSVQHIKHNSIYLVVYDGTPLIKRIQIFPDIILLKSDNSFYPVINADSEKITSIYSIVKLLRNL